MNATTHLPRLAAPARTPKRRLAGLRVRYRRASLDRRLAAGADPRTDPDLSRRAEQLTDAGTRLRIAIVLDRLLDEAAGPTAPFSSKVPLARTAIVACAPRLCELAGRLEGAAPLTAQGIAQAAILVREGDSPLFSTTTSDSDLNRHLAAIIEALG